MQPASGIPGSAVPAPRNPEFRQAVTDAFARQPFNRLIGAKLGRLEEGLCEIHLPFQQALTQHFGYLHGGATAALIDMSGGFAGWTLLPAGQGMLTVEYKSNLIAPATGEALLGRGRVVRAGRTLTFTSIEVFALDNGRETLCATGQQTLMAVDNPA